jgi:hypothetical protein
MARHEADREDLMAEASALRERVELALPGEAEKTIAGFRDNGRFSLYFGPDPVFHFDADGALRRAFVAGDLYRSQAQTLARLTRSPTGSAVNLLRHDLDAIELERFLAAMRERLDRLLAALRAGAALVIQQVPPKTELLPRLTAAVETARGGRLSAAIKKR